MTQTQASSAAAATHSAGSNTVVVKRTIAATVDELLEGLSKGRRT